MSQENGWISLLLSGDRKAITYFTDNYGQFMYHVCYKVLLSTHDAEEAAQDAVLKAIKGLDRYDRSASLKAWCYTIAYRTAIDYKRRLKPTLSLEQSAEPIFDGMIDHNIQKAETKTGIDSLLSHLDDESRVIVSLYYLEEKNIKEVVEITGLTESNIKIKLFRARKELLPFATKYSDLINYT